jgi:glutamine cyclotransferase
LTDRIVRISPQTGQVTGWIDLEGLLQAGSEPVDVLNGIAYDAETDRLFVTGKLWPYLFEIEVIPLENSASYTLISELNPGLLILLLAFAKIRLQ